MAMGMTRDEYWNGDIYAAFDYYEAYILKQKAANENAWLQGMYVYDAVGSVLSSMFAKKGEKGKSYTDKPYAIYEREDEQSKKRKEETNRNNADMWMKAFVEYGKNWGKK